MVNNRYLRQLALKDFGERRQAMLSKAKVLVVGAGGLGVPVLQYLTAMGVGTIGVMDGDYISRNNLHRQVLYTEQDIEKNKAKIACSRLCLLNSEIELKSYSHFLTTSNALDIISNFDIVMDTSDNFPTRYLINDACEILGKPFVYGAVHGFEGQISVFNFQDGPTYRCLFPKMPGRKEIPDCSEQGILGILPGIIGCAQGLEAIKILTHLGESASGRLLIFDALHSKWHEIKISKRAGHKSITQLQSSYETNCPSSISFISVKEFLELYKLKELQLIDVRNEEEFIAYHLPGSTWISLDTLDDKTDHINFEKDVYLICQTGTRSATAVEQLKRNFSEAKLFSVQGGLDQLLSYASTN